MNVCAPYFLIFRTAYNEYSLLLKLKCAIVIFLSQLEEACIISCFNVLTSLISPLPLWSSLKLKLHDCEVYERLFPCAFSKSICLPSGQETASGVVAV